MLAEGLGVGVEEGELLELADGVAEAGGGLWLGVELAWGEALGIKFGDPASPSGMGTFTA